MLGGPRTNCVTNLGKSVPAIELAGLGDKGALVNPAASPAPDADSLDQGQARTEEAGPAAYPVGGFSTIAGGLEAGGWGLSR